MDLSPFSGTTAAEGLEWILRHITLNTDDLARWRTELAHRVHPEGCVLTSDAALLLTNDRGSGQLTAWDRADGQQLWQVDLPSVPLRDGLAEADDVAAVRLHRAQRPEEVQRMRKALDAWRKSVQGDYLRRS